MPERTIDAVLCPRHYPPGKADMARHYALRDEFAPLFGGGLIYTRHQGTHHSLVTPFGDGDDQPRYFWTTHPRANQERYEWTDRGDGVLYGRYVEGAHERPA